MTTIAPPPDDLQFSPIIDSQLRDKTRHLNMLPETASQALQLSNQPDCSIQDFCAVVERDAKLATDVLRMANSAIYCEGRTVTSLSHAVIRLGFQQCRNLIFASSTAALMKKIKLEEEWIRESLCRHGFLTAIVAVKLNRVLNLGFQGEEFTVGLIHDIGRTLFAITYPDDFGQADDMQFDEDASDFLEKERSVLGIDHCQIGAWFADINQLPKTLSNAIRFHHAPQLAGTDRKLTSLIAASDHMANYLHRFGNGSGYRIEDNGGLQLLEADGTHHACGRLRDAAGELMDASASEAGDMTGF